MTRPSVLLCIGMMLAPSVHAQDESASDETSCLVSETGGDISFDGDQECLDKSDLLGSLGLAAPTNPLFTLMGATPENVITPKTGDELMLSLLPQAVDAFGEQQYAIASEGNPGLMMLPDALSPADLYPGPDGAHSPKYRIERALSLFTLTGAVNKTTGNLDSTKYGVGITFNYDTKHPLVNNEEFRTCVSERQELVDEASRSFAGAIVSFEQLLNAVEFGNQGRAELTDAVFSAEPTRKELEEVLRREGGIVDEDKLALMVNRILQIRQGFTPSLSRQFSDHVTTCQSNVTRWNRDVYSAGVALYHADNSIPGTTDAATAPPTENVQNVTGQGYWISLAFESPFGRSRIESDGHEIHQSPGQFILHGRYTDDLVRERGSGDDAVTELVESWLVGARYVHQFTESPKDKDFNARAIRGFIEGAYVEEDFSDTTDEFWQAGIGVEIQVRKDLFVQAVIGDTFNDEIDRSTYLSGQLKWSFSKHPVE